jgi:NtrC-family two-component system sensor histidine kinase KinB
VTLKTKLILAQAPLAIALALLGLISGIVTDRLGEEASRILADNYRSVLAAQKMKESLERLDSQALVALAGRMIDRAGVEHHRNVFESELVVEEKNVTEHGEADAVKRLRAGWINYWSTLSRYNELGDAQARDRVYFGELAPAFVRLKSTADEVLHLNQDAMVRKSQRTERRASLFQTVVIAAVLALAMFGLAASISLTTRLLRPVHVVAAAVRRFGGGDLGARARVSVKDEIGQLADEFNTMAERLARYRASSLGELLQAQQAAQAAIDSLPDPVVMMDVGGKVSGHNRATAQLLKIDLDNASTDPLSGIDPGIRAALDRFRSHAVTGKGSYVPRGFEDAIRLATAEGERIFLPRAMPIYGESGEVNGAAVVFQDITRLFRADEMKNNLVATVAHEFRTPLTSLRMAIHLCAEGSVGPLTPKQGDLLFAAREDCERLQSMVDELLNLSRIESGRIDLHKRRASPESLVTSAIDIHRQAAEDRHVTLRADLTPGLPDVFADSDRLQLVFTNLLSNAIRYSPAGGEIVVSARVEYPANGSHADEHVAAGAGWIRFAVTDEGPGISPEHQNGLFEKFFRVPGSPEGGAGLGLFIAKGLVQAHGGDIGVDSTPGNGARFWFQIATAPNVPPRTFEAESRASASD